MDFVILTIIPPTLESLDVIYMMGVCIESRNVCVHIRTRAVFDIGDSSILVAMETLERRVTVHGERSAPVLHHQCSVRSFTCRGIVYCIFVICF